MGFQNINCSSKILQTVPKITLIRVLRFKIYEAITTKDEIRVGKNPFMLVKDISLRQYITNIPIMAKGRVSPSLAMILGVARFFPKLKTEENVKTP